MQREQLVGEEEPIKIDISQMLVSKRSPKKVSAAAKEEVQEKV